MITVVAGDGARLAVEVAGPAARPVMFLHSIGCDHRLWDAQAARLAGRRVIRPDLRGHGGSAAPAGDYALDRLVGDALEVLEATCDGAAVVCGLSLGGLVAMGLALAAPDRVVGLVLANTAPRLGAPDAWRDRAAKVRAEGLASIGDLAMQRFFSEAFRATHPEAVAETRARLVGGSAEGYAGCCAVLRDADLTEEVGRIAAPCLVVAGRLDVSTPPAQMAALAGAIPGAAYAELDAAHLSNLEQPAAFGRCLADFLEGL
jgi:3-oxoadipate enol-lactonase